MIDKPKIIRQALFRYLILAALVAAAAFLWVTEGEQAETIQPTPAPTRNERIKREDAYEKDVAALQKLLETGAADEATQELAASNLARLVQEHQNEIGLENALQEAGYENAVVIIQSGAATVIIPQEQLSDETSAQILTLCVAHAQVSAENVRVMGK